MGWRKILPHDLCRKGGLLDLFKPICDEYHIPIVSSKGWPPILLRYYIAKLSQRAESNGLTPVLLLFYDHDPSGLKISSTFRKNLQDCIGGTGWKPDKLVIERFGLNKEDIERYGLSWIENLLTESGRVAKDYEYISTYGERKCECNALFKNDLTLKAGEEICIKVIEKYYGSDSKNRFRKKEKSSKSKLGHIYDDPMWADFFSGIDRLVDLFSKMWTPDKKAKVKPAHEKEFVVFLDNEYYGECPRCHESFNYSEKDNGRLVRCRNCFLSMRLRLKKPS